MTRESSKRPLFQIIWGAFAILFGLMTLKEGGSVLFFDGAARSAAGDYVLFVLIFNFTAGFFYILAGAGILAQRKWTMALAASIATLTALVFSALGLHIARGGAFEPRTVVAMSLRTGFWIATCAFLYFQSKKKSPL